MNAREQPSEKFQKWLEDRARAIRYPPMPSIAAQVAARLEGKPALERRHVWFDISLGFGFPRGVAVALVIAFSMVGLLVAVFPPARVAVASFFGLSRIEVVPVEGTLGAPSDASSGLQRVAGLTTLADAQRRAGFAISGPTYPEGLEQHVSVYFQDLQPGMQVVLVYSSSPELKLRPPDRAETLLVLFQFETGGYFRKEVYPSTLIEEVEVEGMRALWFEGTLHELQYIDAEGNPRTEFERTVTGNTLAWEVGEITYRIETTLPKEEAIRIAESLRYLGKE